MFLVTGSCRVYIQKGFILIYFMIFKKKNESIVQHSQF